MLTLDQNRMITLDQLLGLARKLLEHGEESLNPEYLRALVELCTDAAGLPMNGGKEIVQAFLTGNLHEAGEAFVHIPPSPLMQALVGQEKVRQMRESRVDVRPSAPESLSEN
jgi:hypothetical protein